MEIVQNGDPVLRALAKPVQKSEFGGGGLLELIRLMEQALDGEEDDYSVGVALAAPQVGVGKRLFVVRYDRTDRKTRGTGEPPELGVFINPVIVKHSRKKVPMDEGCLSVRRRYGYVPRYERATVEAYDAYGKKFTRGGGGLLAQIFQHEIDHLDGMLFIDRASETWEQGAEDTQMHE